MRRLRVVLDHIRSTNRHLATNLGAAIDQFARNPTPELLDDIQGVLRQGQMACENELRRLRGVARRRRARYPLVARRRADLGRSFPEQYALLERRTELIELQKRMLRQLADALVWVVLGRNHRIIAPLYSKQTHTIPREQGLAGMILVETTLHESGRFFVLEVDLARCVGTGDLLLVRAGRLGSVPLPLELKSSGEMVEGAELGIAIGMALSPHPDHQAAYEEAIALLEAGEAPDEVIRGERADRQMSGLESSMKRVMELAAGNAKTLRPAADRHWKRISAVIARAMSGGSSYDLLEAEAYTWAVRNDPGDDPGAGIMRVMERLRTVTGLSSENPHTFSSTGDLSANDQLAAYVLPIALWEIPLAQRIAILTEQVVVGGLRRAGLIERRLQELGVTMERIEGGYAFRRDGRIAVMSSLEVGKIEAAVALTGVSAQDVASIIAEAVENSPREEDEAQGDSPARSPIPPSRGSG